MEPKNDLSMGDILPNGATVLRTRKGSNDALYVLAVMPGNVTTPFVSWQYHWDGEAVHTYWGNYYSSLAHGLADFCNRGG